MAEQVSSHVERLHRYLPFSPAHDQIYEEYQRSQDSLNLDTKAFAYIQKAVGGSARLIVLTGDAGHGKTHLCRRLIELHLGYEEDEARRLVNEACDGAHLIEAKQRPSPARPLRIFKDLSEFTVPIAVQRLEQISSDCESVVVVCANEGRLRAILESRGAGDFCRRLRDAVAEALSTGWSSKDGTTHVVNLNHQSVASGEQDSFIWRAAHEWLSGTRWRVCQDCDSNAVCPINHNRTMLSPQASDLAETRRTRLASLFATVERLGAVVTVREILMVVAYLLTGGLRCSDVHSTVRKTGRHGWQHHYAFYNLLFWRPPRLRADQLARIPVLLDLARLDPGVRASREVDERLVNEQGVFAAGQLDLLFQQPSARRLVDASNGIDEIVGNPRNRKERRSESDFVFQLVRSLRRRAFFDRTSDAYAFIKRLGFAHADEFLEVLNGGLKPQRMAAIKSRVIAGLHTIQGLEMAKREATLHLVDPAFGSATKHAAIVARRIPSAAITLVAQSEAWSTRPAEEGLVRMNQVVDWIDRSLILRIEPERNAAYELPLNLMLFDCIARAADGFVAEEFYGHEVRRVSNFLGRLAERGVRSNESISVSIHGELRSISIDQGVIQVGGGQ
jgi:hypothetical protein